MSSRNVLMRGGALVFVGTLAAGCTIGEPEPASSSRADDSLTITQTSTTTVASSAVVPDTVTMEPIAPESLPGEEETLGDAASSTDSLSAALQAIVDDVVAQYGGQVSLAVSDGEVDYVGGDDAALPAWSTIKVPIAIAALRQDPSLSPTASAAIQSSDNAAAETLWATVTPPQVEAVLAEASAPVAVNKVKTRPEFSIFGQTAWSPSQQARFVANLPCVQGSQPVLDMMSQIVPGQDYGIGQLPGARFKGGWGPDTSGMYDVRQFGRFAGPKGYVAVALTASPADGSYATAQAMATALAQGLSTIASDLPVGACQ